MEFWEAAARQRGYLDLAAAAASGLSQHQVNRLVRNRQWQRPHPGVYRTGAAPPEWKDKVRAAVLAGGGLSRAMGRTGIRLRGYDGADRHHLIELTVPIGHMPVPQGVIVHRTRRIDPALTTYVDGIPVSCVNENLREYAWLVKVDQVVARAVEHAFLRGDTHEAALRRFLAAKCGRGVPGVRHLVKVLDDRLDGRPARSGFEVVVSDVLREYGIVPLPTRRPLLSVPPDQKFELDLAYVDLKIDIEAMGDQWHSTPQQRRQDRERRKVLEALGWIIIEVTWSEAMFTPWVVAERVRTALGSRRGLGPARP